jgi:hypothetical protein
MSEIDIRIEGFNYEAFLDLEKRLDRVFSEQEKTKGIKVGLEIVQREMQGNVHKVTGNLWNSIQIEKDRTLSKFGDPVMRVGRRKKRGDWKGQGWHAHLIESGTKPHIIRSKSGKPMPIFAKGTKGPIAWATEIHHPGSRAFHPFSNAIESVGDRAGDMALEYFGKLVEKEISK